MPPAAARVADRGAALRSATLASLGVALWLAATPVLVLVLPDDGGGAPGRWALALRWVLSNGGALLALLGAHGLARGIRAALRRHRDIGAVGEDHRTRRRPALVLVAAGLALNAVAESQSLVVRIGDAMPPVYGEATLVASYAAPVVLALGVSLALRRLAVLVGSRLSGHDDEPAREG